MQGEDFSQYTFRAVKDQLVLHHVMKDNIDNELSDRSKKDEFNTKSIESWRIIFEKIRYFDDNRIVRPMIIMRIQSYESEEIHDISYWFVVMDLVKNKILG